MGETANKSEEGINENDTQTFDKMNEIIDEQLGGGVEGEHISTDAQPSVEDTEIEDTKEIITSEIETEKVEIVVDGKPVEVDMIKDGQEFTSEPYVDQQPNVEIEDLKEEQNVDTIENIEGGETSKEETNNSVDENNAGAENSTNTDLENSTGGESTTGESIEGDKPSTEEDQNTDQNSSGGEIQPPVIQPNIGEGESNDQEERPKLESEEFNEADLLELTELLRNEHYFSYDSVGSHFVDTEISEDVLKSFHIDFVVAGICSTQPHYRILELLNNAFGLVIEGKHESDEIEDEITE